MRLIAIGVGLVVLLWLFLRSKKEPKTRNEGREPGSFTSITVPDDRDPRGLVERRQFDSSGISDL